MAKPRDPRTFVSFAKLAADGSVAAIVEVEVGAANLENGQLTDEAGSLYVDVTDLKPFDFSGVIVPPGKRDHANAKAILAAGNKARGR